MSKDAALFHLLRYDHFPPIIGGERFARLAIEAVKAGEPNRVIEHGGRSGFASSVVREWHLDFFIDMDDAGELAESEGATQ